MAYQCRCIKEAVQKMLHLLYKHCEKMLQAYTFEKDLLDLLVHIYENKNEYNHMPGVAQISLLSHCQLFKCWIPNSRLCQRSNVYVSPHNPP